MGPWGGAEVWSQGFGGRNTCILFFLFLLRTDKLVS